MKAIFRRASWAGLLLAFLAAGCSTLEVHSDHNPGVDFSKYHSYAWAPPAAGQAVPDISGVPSDLLEARIQAAVDKQLSAKGLRKAPPGETPDLLISVHVVYSERLTAHGAGGAVGYVGRPLPWIGWYDFPYQELRAYSQSTLVLDLTDRQTQLLVWRGFASDISDNPEKSAEKINQAVAATLKLYPPSSRQG